MKMEAVCFLGTLENFYRITRRYIREEPFYFVFEICLRSFHKHREEEPEFRTDLVRSLTHSFMEQSPS
jgi:hypothetical protein